MPEVTKLNCETSSENSIESETGFSINTWSHQGCQDHEESSPEVD